MEVQPRKCRLPVADTEAFKKGEQAGRNTSLDLL